GWVGPPLSPLTPPYLQRPCKRSNVIVQGSSAPHAVRPADRRRDWALKRLQCPIRRRPCARRLQEPASTLAFGRWAPGGHRIPRSGHGSRQRRSRRWPELKGRRGIHNSLPPIRSLPGDTVVFEPQGGSMRHRPVKEQLDSL